MENNGTKILLEGDFQSWYLQSMKFQIYMCDNSTFEENATEKCHSIEEITEYLKYVTVETWASYGSIDFSLHFEGPVRR